MKRKSWPVWAFAVGVVVVVGAVVAAVAYARSSSNGASIPSSSSAFDIGFRGWS